MLPTRRHEISRLEAFSDAAFAFALTLLVVSLDVPRSYGELMGLLKGFLSFACCFALLVWIWHEHNMFFRRYGLQDPSTVFLNGILWADQWISVYTSNSNGTAAFFTSSFPRLSRCARQRCLRWARCVCRHSAHIRLALGAQQSSIMTLVVGQGLRLFAMAAVVGVAGALAGSRLVEAQLFGVAPTDPSIFVTVVALLAAISVLACAIPAHRPCARIRSRRSDTRCCPIDRFAELCAIKPGNSGNLGNFANLGSFDMP
jgi:hypothetical protein